MDKRFKTKITIDGKEEITMASKTRDVVEFNDTEYDLNDKEDVIELFNDLIYTINYLRETVRDLRQDIDYTSSHCVYGHED